MRPKLVIAHRVILGWLIATVYPVHRKNPQAWDPWIIRQSRVDGTDRHCPDRLAAALI